MRKTLKSKLAIGALAGLSALALAGPVSAQESQNQIHIPTLSTYIYNHDNPENAYKSTPRALTSTRIWGTD